MLLIEIIGVVLGALIVFAAPRRHPLHWCLAGLLAHTAFIFYGITMGALPVLILHAMVLPLTLSRLSDVLRGVGLRRRPSVGRG